MPFSDRIAIIKAKMDNDVFTTQPEAAARSMDMGFGGATHVTQDEMGQAFYMPGESHEDYINYYSTSEIEEPEGEDDSPTVRQTTVRQTTVRQTTAWKMVLWKLLSAL
jgi:serine protease inhibitor